MSETITIAHLSDVHLGPITGFHPRYWNTKRAFGLMNWARNRRHAYRRDVLERLIADLKTQQPDHIAISGDLINVGLPAEMAQAARWLETVGPPERVSVVPGNHDIYTGIGADRGLARWSAYMAGLAHTGLPYVRRIGSVALIGLNSAHETRPFDASGRVGGVQRRRLAQLLDELGAAGWFRLVMIHHPPLPGLTRASHALSDAAAVHDLMSRHGAELVIHGHLHRNISGAIVAAAGSIPVIGVPAASMSVAHPHEPLARYNLFEIVRLGGAYQIQLIGRGLDRVDGPVVELERRQLVTLSALPMEAL